MDSSHHFTIVTPNCVTPKFIKQARLKEQLGEDREALSAYEQAYALSQSTGNTEFSNIVLLDMASIYKKHEQYDKALVLLNTALETAKKKYDKASTLNRIGIIYDMIHDEQKALAYYEAGLELKLGRGDEREINYWLARNAGITCNDLGYFAKARKYIEQAVSLATMLQWKEEKEKMNQILREIP